MASVTIRNLDDDAKPDFSSGRRTMAGPWKKK